MLDHDALKLIGLTSSRPQAIAFLRQKPLSVYRYSRRNSLFPSAFLRHFSPVPRFKRTVPIDDYVLDVLMRDLIGHDQKPAAFMVYLHLYGEAARWRRITASVRTIADATGLSKSAVHAALTHLRRRQLIATTADHATATPRYRVLRHWRAR
ncbi:MAG: hypothetical protein DMF05_00130 [Verrucomicrobia bacterium]|nr:MAG: hypothetical protein DMF05_00130 [Verrucomicrobiota bacterium]